MVVFYGCAHDQQGVLLPYQDIVFGSKPCLGPLVVFLVRQLRLNTLFDSPLQLCSLREDMVQHLAVLEIVYRLLEGALIHTPVSFRRSLVTFACVVSTLSIHRILYARVTHIVSSTATKAPRATKAAVKSSMTCEFVMCIHRC